MEGKLTHGKKGYTGYQLHDKFPLLQMLREALVGRQGIAGREFSCNQI